MTPVPLAPPVLLVLLTSAPGGQETSVSVPGTNAASAFSASSSSWIRTLLNGSSALCRRSV